MAVVVILTLVALLWLGSNRSTGQGSAAAQGSSGGLNAFTDAIARFEGYYQPGSVAQRTNNPGDIGTYGGKLASYADAGEGWNALANYSTSLAAQNPNWDFYDFFRYYLTGDTMGQPGPNQNPDGYAEYVAGSLGVSPTIPVYSVIGG